MRQRAPFIIRKATGEALVFDACLSEAYAPSVEVTDHPVAQGIDVSDHIRRTADVFSASCEITETPWPGDAPGAYGPARVTAAIGFLDSCFGQFLSVQTTRDGVKTGVVLTRFQHAVTKWRTRVFELGFKQVRVATAQTVTIPATGPTAPTPAVAASLASAQDMGQQAAVGAAQSIGAAGEARDTSALASLGAALGVF